jgi:long-chain acyl-CoA synthetase
MFMTPSIPHENATAATLPALLLEWAHRTPHEVAMREKEFGIWQRLTWQDVKNSVEQFALGLKELGFSPGDRIAIAGENCPEWIIADLAAQSLRGMVVGIYPTNPWPELRYIVNHCKARFIVCIDQEQVDKVYDAETIEGPLTELAYIIGVDMRGMKHYPRGRLLSFEEVSELGTKAVRSGGPGALDQLVALVQPNDVCVIVYTSGTTGKPKGAMLSQANLVASGRALVRRFGLNRSNYVVLCYLPLCHVAERVFSIVFHLITGGKVNFAESIDTVPENLREIAPTVFLGVPRIWEKLQSGALIQLQEARPPQPALFRRALDLASQSWNRQLSAGGKVSLYDRVLRSILSALIFRNVRSAMGLSRSRLRFCGGATVSPEIIRFFGTLGIPVYQCFGMTESGGIVFSQDEHNLALGCSGIALDGVDYKIAEDGEILLRGPSIFQGYLFDEEATSRTFEEGWLRTGDIVDVTETGEIKVVDRKKSIIITSGGKNIAPSELENALKESLFISEAILVGEGRHFLGALIQIDQETVGKWAQTQGIPYTTFKNLSEQPAVRDLIAGVVDEVNTRFARAENVRKFVLLDKELDHDDGELTATQKVRRNMIETKFARELSQIYGKTA